MKFLLRCPKCKQEYNVPKNLQTLFPECVKCFEKLNLIMQGYGKLNETKSS